ncbi:MAG: transcriptional regulator [Archangium gephyra]|uniref:Transcriptional regulator n=1 Tax=Archangium gephyra TaxID=48 RepID=A0A2W5V3P7_9BACT|nr:MAG: transcriptional regulator [Archangium gephyra]
MTALGTTLGAISDPTRRAILSRLMRGEATVNDLAEPFDMSLPAISKHLKVLEAAGLVTRGRNGQQRPVKLNAAPLREVVEWLEPYRQFWEGSFDRLEAHLATMQKKGRKR